MIRPRRGRAVPAPRAEGARTVPRRGQLPRALGPARGRASPGEPAARELQPRALGRFNRPLLLRDPGDQLRHPILEAHPGLEADQVTRPGDVGEAVPDVAGAVLPDDLWFDVHPELPRQA